MPRLPVGGEPASGPTEIGELHAPARSGPAWALVKTAVEAALHIGAGVQRLSANDEDGLAPALTRKQFLARIDTGNCLEIGPFDCPLVRGPGVRYFDVLDTAALEERSRRHGRPPGAVPRIDYVSPTGDLAIVDRRFASVVSSHVIEHQPDLLAHLKAVAALLEPDGRYYVICPDRRYCCDHFNPGSELPEVLAAHDERRRVHTTASIRAQLESATHNFALAHWLGIHGRPIAERDPDAVSIADANCARAEQGEYIDVHAWAFTDASFRELIGEVCAQAGVPLAIDYVTRTRFGALEFFAELRRTA